MDFLQQARFGGESDLTALLEPCVPKKKPLTKEEVRKQRIKILGGEAEGKEQAHAESKWSREDDDNDIGGGCNIS